MDFKALFIFSLLLSGCFIDAASPRKSLAIAKKFLQLLKQRAQAKGQETLETGKNVVAKGVNAVARGAGIALALLGLTPALAPVALIPLATCTLMPVVCLPGMAAASVMVGSAVTKKVLMKTKQALNDLRDDIEMLRESGLDQDNEFSTFALRKINNFRTALEEMMVEAVVETNKKL